MFSRDVRDASSGGSLVSAAMTRKQRLSALDREVQEVLKDVRELLLDAVEETIRTGSPEPARDRIVVITEIDAEVTSLDEDPIGQTLALVCLLQWLSRSARDENFRPEPDAVLDWIGEHLGKRYQARARYVIGGLEPESLREAVSVYADALGDDLLPALVWIAAALTVLYGDGDPSWLEEEPATRR